MQQDAWRTYLELAMGLTEKPRKRARRLIDSLTAQRGASVEQLRSMTEELVGMSVANREAIARLVRTELDRALGAVGLANAEELADLRERVGELERRLAEVSPPSAARAAGGSAPAKKAAAKKGAAKKTAAKKTAAKKTAAKKTAANGADETRPSEGEVTGD